MFFAGLRGGIILQPLLDFSCPVCLVDMFDETATKPMNLVYRFVYMLDEKATKPII